jgi:hypothetical protein
MFYTTVCLDSSRPRSLRPQTGTSVLRALAVESVAVTQTPTEACLYQALAAHTSQLLGQQLRQRWLAVGAVEAASAGNLQAHHMGLHTLACLAPCG